MSRVARAGSHMLRDSFVRRAISRIEILSRRCQRRITLNRATSSTPVAPARRVVGGGSKFDGNHPVKWLGLLVEINKLAPSRRT